MKFAPHRAEWTLPSLFLLVPFLILLIGCSTTSNPRVEEPSKIVEFVTMAGRGDPEAQKELDIFYRAGNFYPPDITQRLLDEIKGTAERGDPQAQYAMGVINSYNRPPDNDTAQMWFRKAADLGHPEAQKTLGMTYTNSQGVKQNYDETARPATGPNSPLTLSTFALTTLGLAYVNGKGTAQDYNEAMRWFRTAADFGYAEAEYQLGAIYNRNEAFQANRVEAYKWFSLAAAQGHQLALQSRDHVARKLTREQLDDAQRRAVEFAATTAPPVPRPPAAAKPTMQPATPPSNTPVFTPVQATPSPSATKPAQSETPPSPPVVKTEAPPPRPAVPPAALPAPAPTVTVQPTTPPSPPVVKTEAPPPRPAVPPAAPPAPATTTAPPAAQQPVPRQQPTSPASARFEPVVVQPGDPDAAAKAREVLRQKIAEIEGQPRTAAPAPVRPGTPTPAPVQPPPPTTAARPVATAAPAPTVVQPAQRATPAQPAVTPVSTQLEPGASVKPADPEAVARAREVMRQKVAEIEGQPRTAAPAPVRPGTPPPAPVPAVVPPPSQPPPSRPISSSKADRLAELLRRYRADEIKPDQYQAERAKVLAEPD